MSDDESDYEMVRDAVLEAFNPPDDDAAEPSIMCDAIEAAARYIATTHCECDLPHHEEDGTICEWEGACERCKALGRVQNQVEPR